MADLVDIMQQATDRLKFRYMIPSFLVTKRIMVKNMRDIYIGTLCAAIALEQLLNNNYKLDEIPVFLKNIANSLKSMNRLMLKYNDGKPFDLNDPDNQSSDSYMKKKHFYNDYTIVIVEYNKIIKEFDVNHLNSNMFKKVINFKFIERLISENILSFLDEKNMLRLELGEIISCCPNMDESIKLKMHMSYRKILPEKMISRDILHRDVQSFHFTFIETILEFQNDESNFSNTERYLNFYETLLLSINEALEKYRNLINDSDTTDEGVKLQLKSLKYQEIIFRICDALTQIKRDFASKAIDTSTLIRRVDNDIAKYLLSDALVGGPLTLTDGRTVNFVESFLDDGYFVRSMMDSLAAKFNTNMHRKTEDE